MPESGVDVAHITGNASNTTKRLVCNVFATYGVGGDDTFGSAVGRAVKFTNMTVGGREEGRLEATVVCELTVTRRTLITSLLYRDGSS
jgi:acyl-coenzyme A thioesterase 13